ncbi:MAG: hypothetical protein RIK87_29900 [Fuerstiella sp.]
MTGRLSFFLILILALPEASGGVITAFDFDDGTLQGWTPEPFFGGVVENIGAGGNPDGFLRVKDTVAQGGGLFLRAPAPLFGDLSGFFGIRYDVFVFDNGSATTVAPEVFIHGGPNNTTYRSLVKAAPVVLNQWYTIMVEFNAAGFRRSGLLGSVGHDSFNEVLSDVHGVFINMDASTSGEFEAGLDNVALQSVLEPATIAMWAVMGGIGFLAHCRRTKSSLPR